MRRSVLMILALSLVVAACGGDGAFGTTSAPSTTQAADTTQAPEPTPSTTSPPETTATSPPPPETTTTALPTTTTAPEALYLVDATDFFPEVFPGSSGGHGSGCVTPGFDALPDGVWFGFAEAVGGGAITFDLACFFTGETACDAQIEDGFAADEDECLDFWIRNQVATTFTVPIAADARVWYVDMLSGDVGSPTEIPLSSWPSPDSFQDCPGEYCSVWLYVNGGRVTAIVEQYLP